MNPEIQFRDLYKPDYTGLEVTEHVFCRMKDFQGAEKNYHLDLITAAGAGVQRFPVVIFIHGGGFTQPCDKRQAYISMFAKDLTKAGFAVVSPDYPLFDDAKSLDAAGGEKSAYGRAAEAIHHACAWLSVHAEALHLDMTSVSIMGGSAGAMTAFHAIGNYPEDRYRAFVNCWGAPLTLPDMRAFPPTLSIHGDADQLVSYDREAPVQDALEKAGVRHRLITLSGERHTPLGKYPAFILEVLQWLRSAGGEP